MQFYVLFFFRVKKRRAQNFFMIKLLTMHKMNVLYSSDHSEEQANV